LRDRDGPNLAIVTAYNDIHQPFVRLCDGVTQGEAGMELSLFWRGAIALSMAAPTAACPAARPSAIRATPEAAAGGAIGKICAEMRLDASAGRLDVLVDEEVWARRGHVEAICPAPISA
jgi:dihydroxyacid dehydratase/phosphogluconate dehydratase